VLDDGHVVEQGSHDELLAANGYYARQWQVQTGAMFTSAVNSNLSH